MYQHAYLLLCAQCTMTNYIVVASFTALQLYLVIIESWKGCKNQLVSNSH